MMIDHPIRYFTPLFIFKKNFTNKTIKIMREREREFYFTPARPEYGHMAATLNVAYRSIYRASILRSRWPFYLLYTR